MRTGLLSCDGDLATVRPPGTSVHLHLHDHSFPHQDAPNLASLFRGHLPFLRIERGLPRRYTAGVADVAHRLRWEGQFPWARRHALKPEFEISTDTARLDLEVIHGFLRTSYWAEGRARSVVERSIRNSLCFGAYLAERQVAFARVVSDRAVFAYLMDVFVVPEFRGQGISKAMRRAVLDHPDLQGLRVFLLGTRDAHGLYAQFGFRPLAEPGRWMAIQDPSGDGAGLRR